MNIIKRKLQSLLLLSVVVLVQSCNDDPEPLKPGTDGYFVVNEGTFGNTNASISFYDRETDLMINDVFTAANGRALGDQAQSMNVFEGKGYIVVQNSGKIEVIDADDYTSLATITDGIESPRFLLAISSSKAYVSDWGLDGVTGTVKVLDLTSNMITKSIATGKGANRMLKVGNVVYVTNSGGFDKDNTIRVIDTNSDAITATIAVGDNPNSLQQDSEGNIWVASSGFIAFNTDWTVDEANSTKGSISKISPDNVEILRLEVSEIAFGGAAHLGISPDGTTMYYLYNGEVYSMKTTDTTLTSTPIASNFYYGLSIDPFNGNIIGTLSPNFTSSGSIEVMDEDGKLLDTHTVGIGPNGIAFK